MRNATFAAEKHRKQYGGVGDGGTRWRGLLGRGSRVAAAGGRAAGGERLHGRQARTAHLWTGLERSHWTRGGGGGGVRPGGTLLWGAAGGVLHHLRSHDAEPPGKRRGDAV